MLRKNIRSTKAQIAYLCQYMSEHPDFAAGEFRGPLGAARMLEEWLRLTAALDEIGPHRSVDQWKTCWRDQKRKARGEGGALNRALNLTGNISQELPTLSENSALVLGAIGPEMAVGFGPGESPIGSQNADVARESPIASQNADVGQEGVDGTQASRPSEGIFTRSAGLGQSRPTRRPRRRVSQTDLFLKAQQEMNNILKDLTKQLNENMQRSNNLLQDLNSIMNKISNK